MVSKKDKYLASAQKLIERGHLDKALVEFARVVQEDPKDSRTWLKMAELHAKRGENTEASDIYLRTGDLYAEQGFAQKAVAVYKNVLKLSPGTVAAHSKMGALFSQLGLVSDAVQQFELAAAALQRGGKAADAVAALSQAVELQPDNVVLRVKLAESASHAGLITEAVREFGKAAELLKTQGRVDESLRVMERLLFHQPDNFGRARELAEAYIAKGTPRLALPKLQACLNGDPHDPRTLSLLAKALEKLGQVPKAISVLKELVRLCQELGRATERDAAVLRGLTLDPTDAELLAAATRHQLRATAGGGVADATPPPQAMAAPPPAGGGSFDLSGGIRVPSARTSGGVVAAASSVATESGAGAMGAVSLGVAPDVNRILAEAEVFVKYGLLERAAEHLGRVFELEPANAEARERLIAVLQRLGRKEDVARHAEILSSQLAQAAVASAASAEPSGEAVTLDSSGPVGGAVVFEVSASVVSSPAPGIAVDDVDDPAADMLTPPPTWSSASGSVHATAPATDFDGEIRTGDVLLASVAEREREIEFSIDVGDDDYTDETNRDTGPTYSDGEASDEDTPRIVRTAMVMVPVSDGNNGEGSHLDEEDPTTAFSDDAATVAGEGIELHPSGSSSSSSSSSAAGSVGGTAVSSGLAAADEEELSAELEQVSFFLDQVMLEEARLLLHDLEGRFPGHSRIVSTMDELQACEARQHAEARENSARAKVLHHAPAAAGVNQQPGRTATAPAPLRSTIIGGSRRDRTPTPRAIVNGVDASDLSTHADLAIAYKGMGLLDAAIAELKLLTQNSEREVFALTTMGECYESKGSFTEAIIRYKRALNCEQINRQETIVLYFLLGAAFEHLGDVSEALYFFEKVVKRDPKFREVDQRVAALKPRLAKRAP